MIRALHSRTRTGVVVAAAVVLGLASGFAVLRPLNLAVFALAILLGLPLIVRVARGLKVDPLEPLWPFSVCYFITYGLKPLVDAAGGTTYGWFRFDVTTAVVTVLIAAVLLLFIYVGYFSHVFRVLLPLLPPLTREPSSWRVRVSALLLAGGGLVVLMFLMRAVGPQFSFVSASQGAYRALAVKAAYGRGYLILLATLASLAPPLQFALALRTKAMVDQLLTLVLLGVVGAMLTVLYSRQLFLQTLVILIVVAYFRGRWLTPRLVVACGILLLIGGGWLGLRLYRSAASPLTAVAFLGHTFDSFEFVGAALDRVSMFGHFGGRTFVEDWLLTFLPRALFPAKPDVFGIVSIQYYVSPELATWAVSTATYPPGFLVEGYANFGAFGIVTIGVAYGLLLRLAREWFWPRRDRLFPMLMYGGFMLNMTGWFRSAAQMTVQTLLYGAILYLLLYGAIPVHPRRDSASAQ